FHRTEQPGQEVERVCTEIAHCGRSVLSDAEPLPARAARTGSREVTNMQSSAYGNRSARITRVEQTLHFPVSRLPRKYRIEGAYRAGLARGIAHYPCGCQVGRKVGAGENVFAIGQRSKDHRCP